MRSWLLAFCFLAAFLALGALGQAVERWGAQEGWWVATYQERGM